MTKRLLFFVLLNVSFLSCGLKVFYFLPQVPQVNITITKTDAVLDLESLSEFSDIGASYSIYYKIYMSDFNTITQLEEEFSSISTTLGNDFSALKSYTDPAVSTQVTDANTFRTRRYYELQFEERNIITNGNDIFNIVFPNFAGEIPYITARKIIDPITREPVKYNLFRANEFNGVSFNNDPDRYFFFTSDLIEKTDHVNYINNDVFLRGTSSDPIKTDPYAFVSMYIVAVGYDPEDFNSIYGKPTHIGVFRLTNKF